MYNQRSNYIRGFFRKNKMKDWREYFTMSVNLEQIKSLPIDQYGKVNLIIWERKTAWRYWELYDITESKPRDDWFTKTPAISTKAKEEEIDDIIKDLPF